MAARELSSKEKVQPRHAGCATMLRSIAIALLACCLVLGPSAKAQEPVEPWRTKLPAYNDTVVVIGEVYPHVERLVTAPWFAELFGVETTDAPTEVAAELRRNQASFPDRVVLATGDSTLKGLADMAHATLLGAVSRALEDRTESIRVRRQALKLLESISLPRFAVWGEFDSPALPRQALALAKGTMGIQAGLGLQTEQDENSIEINNRLGDVLPPVAVMGVLQQAGVVESGTDRSARDLVKHLLGLRLRARLEVEGNAVWLRVGPQPRRRSEDRPLPIVASVWSPKPDQVLYGQWNTADALEASRALLDAWEAYRDEPDGRTVAAALDDPARLAYFTTVMGVAEGIVNLSARGAGRVTIGQRIVGRLVTPGHQPTPSLKEQGLLELLPKTEGVVYASSQQSAADWAQGAIEWVESGMAAKTNRARKRGDEEAAERTASMGDAYLNNFAGLRRVVSDTLPEAFRPPVALVLRPSGKIDEFRYRTVGPNRTSTGRHQGLSVPELAVVGRVRDGTLAEEAFVTVWAELLESMSLRPPRPALAPFDLGSGQPAQAFALPKESVNPGETLQLTLKGDFVPNTATRGEYLVLSTSPRLTREILDGSGDRYALPKAAAATATDYGSCPPEAAAKLLEEALKLLQTIDQEGTNEQGFDLAIRIVKRLERVEWMTRQSGGTRRTDLAIDFAD